VNLLGTIDAVNSHFIDSTTLRIVFATQSADGDYSIVIGPQILRASDGVPMDQNDNDLTGEVPDDRYTAAFTIDTCIGPDGFGYQACAYPFEALDLVPGAPDVATVLDGVDDGAVAVDLGSNTFSYYGVTYTGASSLFVSSNALITFGSGNAEFTNQDLTF